MDNLLPLLLARFYQNYQHKEMGTFCTRVTSKPCEVDIQCVLLCTFSCMVYFKIVIMREEFQASGKFERV